MQSYKKKKQTNTFFPFFYPNKIRTKLIFRDNLKFFSRLKLQTTDKNLYLCNRNKTPKYENKNIKRH